MPACPTRWWRCATAPWAGISPGSLRQRQGRPRAGSYRAAGLAWAKSAAEDVARQVRRRAHRPRHAGTLARRRRRARLICSTCAIRPNTRPAICPARISAPGGQLVQATDQYAGTLGARIVLSDDNEVRAVMTASWLKQMGWRDVFVLPEAGNETGEPADRVLGAPPADAAIDCSDVARDRQRHRRRSVAQPGLPQGPHSRRLVRHPRAARPRAAENPAARRDRADLGGRRARGPRGRGGARADRTARCAGSRAATPPGPPPAFPLSTDAKMADEPLDAWLKPYERPGDTEGRHERISVAGKSICCRASSATAPRVSRTPR